MFPSNAFPARHEMDQDPFLPQLMDVQLLCRDAKTAYQDRDRHLPSEQRIGDTLFQLQMIILRNLTTIGRNQFAKIMELLGDLLGCLDPLHLKVNFFALETIGASLEELAAHENRPDLIPFQVPIGNWRTILRSRANIDTLLN